MLDMGGAPSGSTSKNNTRVRNTSKNSKVQAVAFDFELLVKAINEQAEDATASDTASPSTDSSPAALPSASSVTPNVDQVQAVASLLNVDLNEGGRKRDNYEDDDLSALLAAEEEPKPVQKKEAPPKSSIPVSLQDIRSKYANKLHKKGVEGGIAGVEMVKYQREEAMKRGDAEGHWAARKIAAATTTQNSGTRWMALTGTGKLLSTLTHRSMKIALLPRVQVPNQQQQQQQDRSPKERMDDLTRQLKDVVFDVVVDLPISTTATESSPEEIMVKDSLTQLSLDPQKILFVSDQDAFLKPAKELGMMTCRIRPLSARRGNVSTHYTVETVLEVHDVVNDINGISFNAVLNM